MMADFGPGVHTPIGLNPGDVRTIREGDHLGMAEAMLDILSERAGGGSTIIHTIGNYWQYGDGHWVRLDKNFVRRELVRNREYLRWEDGRGDEKHVKMTNGLVSSVSGTFLDLVDTPDFFDDCRRGICLRDGFLTIDSGKPQLEPHSPMNRARHKHDFDWDPFADCPRWLRFLDEVWEPDADREEKKRFLQQFLGACLFWMASDHNKVCLMLGGGANGKSVLCDVVESMFDGEAVVSVSPQDFTREYNLARLSGAQVNIVADMATRDLKDLGSFKQVTSGDRVEARLPYGPPFSFRPRAGHIFSCNRLPVNQDHSAGFYRRWVILTFNRRFDGSSSKAQLVDELLSERQGIMAWAVQGAVDLKASSKGYFVPASHEAALEAWRDQTDQIALYLGERVDILSENELESMVSEIYQDYSKWAEDNGQQRISMVNFSPRLEEHGIRKVRRSQGNLCNCRLRPRFTGGGPSYPVEKEEL